MILLFVISDISSYPTGQNIFVVNRKGGKVYIDLPALSYE